eukprot:TRINITY_DN10024_c0_g1_i1.p1 TRINITY_DN10024_c0_g1~~TRINITY_DN10024_c0_g1_i1.p1  ORF type:complete len:309 (-),score=118.95 TRINITY_DN10024_c0_g1_i1:35-910(-)
MAPLPPFGCSARVARRAFATSVRSAQNIIVTGKSGAGKQPRIDVLLRRFGLPQLGTGNIFREYIGRAKASGFSGSPEEFWDASKEWFVDDSEMIARLVGAGVQDADAADVTLGLQSMYFVQAGRFVPDRITNALFERYYAGLGYSAVLDGYPRTTAAAEFLLELLQREGKKIDFILEVDNSDDAIVGRTVGRRICSNTACGKVYHVVDKPPLEGDICKACGSKVVQRADDTEEKIRSRLGEYHAKVKPMIDFLEAKGIPKAVVTGNLPVFTDELVEESVIDSLRKIPGVVE